MDLAEDGADWKPSSIKYEDDCKLQRARESENPTVFKERESKDVKLLAQCTNTVYIGD